MGSGLILLVIVGAWLAVLVPMALRSHDSATSLRSTDRFSDAMKVLSRRGSRDVLVPRRRQTLVVSQTRSTRVPAPVPAPVVDEMPDEAVPVARASAAHRRRRTLLILVAVVLATLAATVSGSPVVLGLHVVADLLLAGFVVHLRRQAVLRRATLRRRARVLARSGAPRPVPVVRIVGIPDRMPARPAPLSVPLPAPAARHEDRLPATGTDGRSWSPVPVPLPTYVGKATAPARSPRVLDLTRPGRWSDEALAASAGTDELSALLEDDGSQLEDILDRRRVVGGW